MLHEKGSYITKYEYKEYDKKPDCEVNTFNLKNVGYKYETLTWKTQI